ncbi:MAG: MFS transporter, partial [Planctomycetota bacterium]
MRPRRIAEYTGLAGYNFLAMVRRGFFYTFLLVYLREELSLPVSLIALIGATNAVTSTLGQLLVWGRLSDRTDRRAALMFTGELVAGVGYLATYLVFRLSLGSVPAVATAGLIILCLGVIEFFWSMTDVGFRAAIAQVTTTANRGSFLGTLELIGLVGMGGGLFLAGHLYQGGRGFENGALWFLAAGFILAGVPLIAATLMHIDRDRVNDSATAARAPFAPAFRRYMLALAVAVLGTWSFLQIHSFFVRLPDTAGASDLELSWIRFAFWVTGGLAAPLMGRLVDRAGSRRVYTWSLLACALLPLTFLATRSVPYAALTLAAYGAAFTGFRTASYTLTAELTPEEARGRHFALYNVVMSL